MALMPYDLRIQHDHMGNAAHLLSERDKARLESNEWFRADCRCICGECGKEYYAHPPVVGALWLLRICGDQLVKY